MDDGYILDDFNEPFVLSSSYDVNYQNPTLMSYNGFLPESGASEFYVTITPTN